MSENKGVALVHVRVSTDEQEANGTSLESQEAACVKLVQELGYTTWHVTREDHTGMTFYDRPLLMQNLADIEAGNYQALVFYVQDRVARRAHHFNTVVERCINAGCAVICVQEPFEDTPEGELIRSMRGYASTSEWHKIKERTQRGKRQRAIQGKLHGAGPDRYGYHKSSDRTRYEICESEAAVVREIFEWAVVERLGTRAIAARLNNRGTPSPSVGKMTLDNPSPSWGKNQIRRMLKYEGYKGIAYYGREKRQPNSKRHLAPKPRPVEEWIQLPDGVIPAIIPTDLWDRAQMALTDRVSIAKTRNERRPYLLRGMVWCGVCGNLMLSNVENTGTAHRSRVYRCSSKDKARGACGGGRIPADLAEQAVWQIVTDALRDPERLTEELQRRQTQGPDAALARDRASAEKQLAGSKRKVNDLTQRYDPDDASFPWEVLKQAIKLEQDKQAGLQAKIAEIDELQNAQALAVEQLKDVTAYCERVAYNLDTFDFDRKRRLLEALRLRVTGNGRSFTITGAIPLESPTKESVGQEQTC